MEVIGTDGRTHGRTFRGSVLSALSAVAEPGDGGPHLVADAMRGIGHGTLTALSETERRSMYGFAAVLVGTPDYGQNEPATDCVDALANVLLYAHRIGADVDRVIATARGHFAAEVDA